MSHPSSSLDLLVSSTVSCCQNVTHLCSWHSYRHLCWTPCSGNPTQIKVYCSNLDRPALVWVLYPDEWIFFFLFQTKEFFYIPDNLIMEEHNRFSSRLNRCYIIMMKWSERALALLLGCFLSILLEHNTLPFQKQNKIKNCQPLHSLREIWTQKATPVVLIELLAEYGTCHTQFPDYVATIRSEVSYGFMWQVILMRNPSDHWHPITNWKMPGSHLLLNFSGCFSLIRWNRWAMEASCVQKNDRTSSLSSSSSSSSLKLMI